jgi:hypothetical protein
MGTENGSDVNTEKVKTQTALLMKPKLDARAKNSTDAVDCNAIIIDSDSGIASMFCSQGSDHDGMRVYANPQAHVLLRLP